MPSRIRPDVSSTLPPCSPDPAPSPAPRGNGWLAIGAVLALLSVAAGAFAAHGLRARLTPEALAAFETAARYQMYHALALVACGASAPRLQPALLAWAAGLFIAGTVLFSGSLYLLSLTGIRDFGIVTPIGGIAWLLGWGLLAAAALGGRRQR